MAYYPPQPSPQIKELGLEIEESEGRRMGLGGEMGLKPGCKVNKKSIIFLKKKK